MFSHILKATLPFRHIEIGITEPSISVVGGATPGALGHVVIEVDVDLLLCELCSDRIVDLQRYQSVSMLQLDC